MKALRDRDSPAEHEDGAGGGVIGQRQRLLQAQLLTAAVEAVRAVDAFGVVVASGAVLHGPQLLGALRGERATGQSWPRRWWVPSSPLLPPSENGHASRTTELIVWPINSCMVSLNLIVPTCEMGPFLVSAW